MKSDWKDDIFAQRKLRMQTNSDGTVTPVDETAYTQKGDAFGAKELNEIGGEVNKIQAVKSVVIPASGWTSAAPYTNTVSVAGVLSTDLPVVLLDVSGTVDQNTEKVLKKQFGWISFYDTADGSITFTARWKKPTIDMTANLKGVN